MDDTEGTGGSTATDTTTASATGTDAVTGIAAGTTTVAAEVPVATDQGQVLSLGDKLLKVVSNVQQAVAGEPILSGHVDALQGHVDAVTDELQGVSDHVAAIDGFDADIKAKLDAALQQVASLNTALDALVAASTGGAGASGTVEPANAFDMAHQNAGTAQAAS